MVGQQPYRLIVVDPNSEPYGQQPAVRVELEADVPARCPETGRRLLLARGRYVVVEERALQAAEAADGVWS